MVEIKNKSKNKDETMRTNMMVGKSVLDDKGQDVGTIREVHVDPVDLTVEGITMDNGLFKDSDYIGRDYIVTLTEYGAVLSQTPLSQYKGKKVIDSAGKHIGKVKDVNRSRKTNSAYAIIVDRGMMNNDLIITDNFVIDVGDAVLLNDEVKE